MTQALLLVVLLAAVVTVAIVAKRVAVPYPIAFVFGGIALAFIPNLPRPHFDPNLIFLIVLPPLLYGGGWSTDWFEFRRNARPIGLLAIGLVVFTTVVVALVAHALAGLDWTMAFTLGAIVAPPDAVAAEAVFQRLAVPRRVVAVLTGEGLVNDATALVLYRFALAAAVSGTFSLAHASATFVFASLGGIAIGLASSMLVAGVLHVLAKRGMQDATIANVLLLLAPYIAYLPADALGASGVLASVAAGIYMSRRAIVVLDAEGRIVGTAVWQVMIFLLNAFVFLLIGLQLPGLVSVLESTRTFVRDALVVSLAVIVVRILWVYPATWLPRALSRGLRERDPMPRSWKPIALVAWTGMRGIVSLAAALALPFTDAHGAPLSGRAEIIVITLCVIAVTLVVQGLSLAPLIRWLGIGETASAQTLETTIRIRALEAAMAHLRTLEPSFSSPQHWEVAGRLLGEYEQRIAHLRGHLDDAADADEATSENAVAHHLERSTLDAEREEIARLRTVGEIPDDVYRAIEYDLDLADMRLR
ncbi:MAG: Na+/H+ antiporter [bacterium]|nr:Na+/H+ antiporter [bacterium]